MRFTRNRYCQKNRDKHKRVILGIAFLLLALTCLLIRAEFTEGSNHVQVNEVDSRYAPGSNTGLFNHPELHELSNSKQKYTMLIVEDDETKHYTMLIVKGNPNMHYSMLYARAAVNNCN